MDAFFSDTLVKFGARLMHKHAGKSLKIVTTCDFSVGLRSKKFTQATQAAPSQDGLKLLGGFESPKGDKCSTIQKDEHVLTSVHFGD